MKPQYTVKQLAKLAGISVKTLHHYDQIGLLKPAEIGDNGYRYYQHQQLLKLMHILFYKELDFSLADIKELVNDAHVDSLQMFLEHQHLMELKQARTQRLLTTINQIITALQGGKTMNPKKVYSDFATEEVDQYKDEVKKRWGHTEAYQQSMERAQQWTKADKARLKAMGEEITQSIAELIDKPVDDPLVQAAIAQHHRHINSFYDCSVLMYRGLGEMYLQDPRFAAYYNKIKPGLAEFMNRAISHYCNQTKD